jgi:hypothetical protein
MKIPTVVVRAVAPVECSLNELDAKVVLAKSIPRLGLSPRWRVGNKFRFKSATVPPFIF